MDNIWYGKEETINSQVCQCPWSNQPSLVGTGGIGSIGIGLLIDPTVATIGPLVDAFIGSVVGNF